MKCMVCGKEMKVVNNFHLSVHNMSVAEYKKLYPDAERFDPGIRAEINEKIRKALIGKPFTKERCKHISEARKASYKQGKWRSPFEKMDKFGENNPAWGTKYHTEEEIRRLREKNSRIMSDLLINDKVSYKTGSFYSDKMDKTYNYKSSYELRMLKILESLDCVSSYIYEPFGVRYMMNKQKRSYVPDFKIVFNDGTIVIAEIGALEYKIWTDKKTPYKVAAILKYCKKNNLIFAMITQYELDKLENMKNSVNCWDELKPFCYSVVGNDKCECLKSERIYTLSAAKPLNDH